MPEGLGLWLEGEFNFLDVFIKFYCLISLVRYFCLYVVNHTNLDSLLFFI